MALGIGSNAAVFAFMTGLLGQRSPVVDQGGAVVTVRAQGPVRSSGLLSSEEFAAISGHTSFASVGAAREAVSAIRSGTRSVTAPVATVTGAAADLFALAAHDGVVLSANATSALGRPEQLTIDGVEHRVSGTAPDWLEGLYIGQPIAAWIIVPGDTLGQHDAGGPTLSILARLAPGVSADDAHETLNAAYPGRFIVAAYTGLAPDAAAGIRRLRILLTAAAAAVFLIAAVNVALLLLSRASRRSHDISIRIALGVTRRTLAFSLLLDAVLIVIPGALAGLVAGMWTADVIPLLLFEQDAEQLAFVPDVSAALVAASACAVLVTCCGMVPLVENRHDTPAAVLRRQAPDRSRGMRHLQSGLVVLQMTGCCALVVGAAFLVDAFRSTLRTHAGRGTGQRLLATVEADAGFGRPDLGLQFFRQIEETAVAVPGVFSTAWIARPPGTRPSWHALTIEPPVSRTRDARAPLLPFTPASIDDVMLPPVAGGMFGGADRPGGCRVAVVNEAAALAWFDGSAVGRWIETRAGDRLEIIGVVAEAKPLRPPSPLVYYYPEQGDPRAAGGAAVTFAIPVAELRRGVLNANTVSDSYFGLMGMRVREGPESREPSFDNACRTAVLNAEAADRYFGGDAVGGATIDAFGRRTTVVGVVEESRLRSTQRETPPSMYLRMEQDHSPRMTLVLAATTVETPFISTISHRLKGVSGGSVRTVTTLDAHLGSTALAAERISALLVGAATLTALALGFIGLHRAVADDLLRRQQEFATRAALGSPPGRLVLVLLRQASRWAVIGAALGLLVSTAISAWLRQVTGFDGAYAPWAWGAGPAVLAVGVLVGSALPALRVMRIDPLIVMKN